MMFLGLQNQVYLALYALPEPMPQSIMRISAKSKLALLAVMATMATACIKKAPKPPTEKIRQLFGQAWVYDTEATRVTVMQKAHDALGGAIKNVKDIQLKGDVKKLADAFGARELYFAPDSKDRGVGYVLTTGKGLLASKSDGWLTWNDDETQLTLTPTNTKLKPMLYTLQELTPKRLVILSTTSVTDTAEVYTR
jgi:hypothetical protein